jgi:amide synthase
MYSVAAHVEHLGYRGSLEPTLQTLCELHKRHLMMVPFDNTQHAPKGLAVWDEVETDADVLFENVVRSGRGGVCHELNGLFRTLLKELGFDVFVLSAGIRGADDRYGPDLEHMLNCVRLGEQLWLADVGFVGPSFLDPLHVTDEAQEQYGFAYRVVEDEGYHVLQRQARAADWVGVYRFKLQPRQLQEWVGFSTRVEESMEWFWEGEMVQAGTVIQGRSLEDGQMILIGKRFVEARDGREQVRVLIDPAKHQAVVDDILRRAS